MFYGYSFHALPCKKMSFALPFAFAVLILYILIGV